MSWLRDAFYDVCREAKEPESAFVSLYCKGQAYGGPEEGGWWRTVITLEASQWCETMERAEAVLEAVKVMAQELTADAQRQHGEMCLRQLEQFGGDGELAQAAYGEVDGPDEYFVCIESVKGSQTYCTPAGYC